MVRIFFIPFAGNIYVVNMLNSTLCVGRQGRRGYFCHFIQQVIFCTDPATFKNLPLRRVAELSTVHRFHLEQLSSFPTVSRLASSVQPRPEPGRSAQPALQVTRSVMIDCDVARQGLYSSYVIII